MRGHVSTSVRDDYARGEQAGRQADTPLEFTATITADDLHAMLRDPAHAARIDGSITCAALSANPLQVTGGTFQLLTADPDRVNARQMIYRMVGTGPGGERFRLDGFKRIEDDKRLEIWSDTTTLFVTITDLRGAAEQTVAKGILHILPADFLKQMTTMEVTGATTPLERLEGIAAFGKFFAGALFQTYGGVLVRSNELTPVAAPRARRALRTPPPVVHYFATGDGTELRLTRFEGGRKGPVIVAPGFGTSTLAFSIDTVDTNLPEALVESGYDVWLFDYRASPDLPSAATQFTLDDVATQDYPAAVARVREVTGADSVQVMAHCVGSMTFLMAMMAGLKGVRSAVSSALTLYPVTPMANRIRAGLDLGTAAAKAGVTTLTTDVDSQKTIDRIVDAALKLVPSTEQCTSAVCRRILGIYGDVFKHANLNAATHDAIHEMFGIANLTTFNHISLMVREDQIVDKDGGDTYLPHLDRLAIPITFITGRENNLFLPEGTQRTLRTLAAANDPGLYQRVEFGGYGHMDMYIGRQASSDVFPTIVAALEQGN
jgi:cholesterol oxidase